MEYVNTPIGLIHPSPTNPRKSFPAEEMAEMIDSVKRHGILQPILVREWPATYAFDGEWPPKYELIAGERRYRAAKGAELDSIPVMVRQLTDNEVLEIQIIENLQRKGLHEIEEAEGYELMIKDHGYTADELAEKIGKSRAYIYGRMKLTALCMGARLAFRDRKLTASTALLIARIPGEKLQTKALDRITAGHRGILSYREAAEVIQSEFCLFLDSASFPQENLLLVPSAGACSTCPKRSGTCPEIFPDIKRADVCTDQDCYQAKTKAWLSYQKAQAESEGKKVIAGEEATKIDIAYSHDKYMPLDRRNYELKGGPTYREAIANTNAEIVLIEDQRSGKLVEAIERKALASALVEAGLKPERDYREEERELERELERKVRAENVYRQRLFAEWHNTMRAQLADDQTPDFEPEELTLVAATMWRNLYGESQEVVMGYWAKQSEAKESWTRRSEMVKEVADRIPTMSRRDLVLLMIDCALAGQARASGNSVDVPPARLIERAQACGIDTDAIRTQIEAEKAAKSAKSKSAKSISTPPKAPLGAGSERELDDTPKVGDRVRVKEGGKAAKRVMARKYCGREGDIEAQRGPFFAVRFAPGKNGVIADLTREEFDLLPAPIAFSTASEPAPTPSKAARARVMYRHPKHETLEWSGRGKQPMWVANWINDGGELEELRVQGEEQKQSSAADASNAKPAMAECAPRCTKTLELPLA